MFKIAFAIHHWGTVDGLSVDLQDYFGSHWAPSWFIGRSSILPGQLVGAPVIYRLIVKTGPATQLTNRWETDHCVTVDNQDRPGTPIHQNGGGPSVVYQLISQIASAGYVFRSLILKD